MARLRPAGPTCPLVGRGLRGPRDLEGGDAGDAVVETFLHPAAVDHVLDPRDGERRLGHVGGHHAQAGPWWRRPEDLHERHKHTQRYQLTDRLTCWLIVSCVGCKEKMFDVTLACFSGANKEYRGRT